MSPSIPPESASARIVEEVSGPGLPAVTHPEWSARYEWLVQGTTLRAAKPTHDPGAGRTAALGGGEPDDEGRSSFDLGLFSDASSPRTVLAHWERLRTGADMAEVVHAHQVHGARVRWYDDGAPGLHVLEPCDGHATARAGVLLAVTVADCVPVSIVDPLRRAVALVHAGWRGTAADILEHGLNVLAERVGSRSADLRVHLGPAICGRCYEVGPEVFEALGLDAPRRPSPIDLRAVLARRAAAAGVAADAITISAHCTLCGRGFFSHRGGDSARQVGFLGIRGQ